MTPRLTLTCLVFAASALAHAKQDPEALTGTWRCTLKGSAISMTWDAMVPANMCDAETCRLATERPMRGLLVGSQGRPLGLMGLRPHGPRGWTFRDLDGGTWQLRHTLLALRGSFVGGNGARHPVVCAKAPPT